MLEKDERNKEIEKEMKEKLANGDHGYITFKLNNKTRYAYFSDVERHKLVPVKRASSFVCHRAYKPQF